jgi:hypothetical protein
MWEEEYGVQGSGEGGSRRGYKGVSRSMCASRSMWEEEYVEQGSVCKRTPPSVPRVLVCRRASEQYVSQGGIAVYVLRRRCVAVFLRS